MLAPPDQNFWQNQFMVFPRAAGIDLSTELQTRVAGFQAEDAALARRLVDNVSVSLPESPTIPCSCTSFSEFKPADHDEAMRLERQADMLLRGES